MRHLPTALLALPLFLAGCSGSLFKPTFHFDNPGEQPLALQVDGQAHTIPAHAELALDLAPGSHTLQSQALGKVDFIVYDGARDALVNPTLADYYLADEVYVTDAAQGRNFGNANLHVQVQGVDVEGSYWQTHALFIPKDWDFGVHENFPDSVTQAHVSKEGGKKMRKVFAADDFAHYLEQGAGQPGYFAAQRPKDWQPPHYTLADVAPSLPALAPAFEAHAADLRKVVDEYLHASDPARQRELRKQQFQAQMAFTQATASLGQDLPVEENRRYNAFVGEVSQIMAAPAAVIGR